MRMIITGGIRPQGNHFLKWLVGLLAEHDSLPYSVVMGWLQIRLSFAIVRCAVMCICGSRSSCHRPVHSERELAVAEARLLTST